jgi:hypothetical protein
MTSIAKLVALAVAAAPALADTEINGLPHHRFCYITSESSCLYIGRHLADLCNAKKFNSDRSVSVNFRKSTLVIHNQGIDTFGQLSNVTPVDQPRTFGARWTTARGEKALIAFAKDRDGHETLSISRRMPNEDFQTEYRCR